MTSLADEAMRSTRRTWRDLIDWLPMFGPGIRALVDAAIPDKETRLRAIQADAVYGRNTGSVRRWTSRIGARYVERVSYRHEPKKAEPFTLREKDRRHISRYMRSYRRRMERVRLA